MTIRQNAAPKVLLVKRSEDLSAFADRLGRVMFDTDWRGLAANAPSSGSAGVGTTEETTFFLRNQILSGIRAKKVKLRAHFNSAGYKRIENWEEKRDEGGAQEYDFCDAEYRWYITEEYWLGNPDVDWTGSCVKVPGNMLIGFDDEAAFSDFFEANDHLPVRIEVTNPDEALRKAYQYSKIPDEIWIKRYAQYVTIVAREVVAAAWRIIAICDLSPERGSRALIIQKVLEYAAQTDLNVSDDTVSNLTDKVIAQWKKGDLASAVFVNSTRTGSARKRIGDQNSQGET